MTETSNNGFLTAHTLVVGGGISGLTAALELAETGKEVLLVEKEAFLGGRVARMNLYFPKLCPPSCGLEINFKRLKNSARIKFFTLAEVHKISGAAGSFDVEINVSPRYVNDKCTACGDCEKVCEIEVDNDFDYKMGKKKAISLPHDMSFPHLYTVEPSAVKDPRMQKCVDACKYKAIDLNMQPETINAKVASVIWAAGWTPYDAMKIDNLGFGKVPNVINNVMMERLAAVDGPTQGKILRPSDNQAISTIAFVQCAGSRDEKHLPYCSAVCCLASIKQATYVRQNYPDAEIHIFYIDIRTPGRMEDFYAKVSSDPKIHFHRGKAAEITAAANGNVKIVAEDTLSGNITSLEVNMAVLATGMQPNTALNKPPINIPMDENGFLLDNISGGIIGTGTVVRPVDVSASVQDSTGAAMKALTIEKRR